MSQKTTSKLLAGDPQPAPPPSDPPAPPPSDPPKPDPVLIKPDFEKRIHDLSEQLFELAKSGREDKAEAAALKGKVSELEALLKELKPSDDILKKAIKEVFGPWDLFFED